LLPKLRSANATLIAVTNEPESTLAKESDICINTASATDHIIAIQTYTATVLTMNLLSKYLEEESLNDLSSIQEWLHNDCDSMLRDTVKQTESYREIIGNAIHLYCLARGASIGSALEGVLMLHEATKYPAIFMETSQFRHGPIEVLNPNIVCLLYAQNDHTREYNIHLANDIQKAGGKAILIDTNENPYETIPTFQIPTQFSLLRTVIEIFPIQAISICLAEWKGLDVGKFYFATQVTRDESGFGQIEK
jgi:glucosamine--fructose-6-phosphate aminotransferase (isomerizing)